MKETSKKISKPPRLSEGEWIVMKPFWEKGSLAARDLFASISSSNKWSCKTVKTMLARLVKKGALEYTQVGNSYLYNPRFSKDEMIKAEVKKFSHHILGGSLRPFLVNFFEGRNPSKDEISALKEIMHELKKEK